MFLTTSSWQGCINNDSRLAIVDTIEEALTVPPPKENTEVAANRTFRN